jgi:hypothetical protein
LQSKPLTVFLILLGLVAATIGGYAVGRALTDAELSVTPSLPPLSPLKLPVQTDGQYTAEAVSSYADASHVILRFRISGKQNRLIAFDSVDLYDTSGEFINSSLGYGPADENDPSLYQFDFNPVAPLPERLLGTFRFRIVDSLGEGEALADFSFNLDLPVHPAEIYNPQMITTSNGVELLLDRLVITASHTQAYLCYNKPSAADWGLNQHTTLEIDGKSSSINEYALLYDSEFGDLGKGGDPDWTPNTNYSRCIQVGFQIGGTDPGSVTLTIPTLEQSTPEVIPEDDLAIARAKLLPEGIDIDWEVNISPQGGGSVGPVYNKLPAGMSQQEAYERLLDALGYFHKGPWIIKVNVKP